MKKNMKEIHQYIRDDKIHKADKHTSIEYTPFGTIDYSAIEKQYAADIAYHNKLDKKIKTPKKDKPQFVSKKLKMPVLTAKEVQFYLKNL